MKKETAWRLQFPIFKAFWLRTGPTQHLPRSWNSNRNPSLLAWRTRIPSSRWQQQLESGEKKILQRRVSQKGSPKGCILILLKSLAARWSMYTWGRLQAAQLRMKQLSIYFCCPRRETVWNLSTAKLINYYLSLLGLPLQYHKTGWLKESNFIFSQFQRLESKIKVPAGSESGESAIRGLHIATFSLCPHMVERERASSLLSLLIRALPLTTSSNPDYLPKAPSPNTITFGLIWRDNT